MPPTAGAADSAAYSQMLSSTSSLTSSHGSPSTPNITRTYKQASQLFLTRRVPEALQILEPIIQPRPHTSSSISSAADAEADANGNDSVDASADGSTYGTDGTSSSGTPAEGIAAAAAPGAPPSRPPIATASRGARVKVWSLYISMLNSIAEMSAEEGRKAFGSATRWKELAGRARDAGAVWDDVVRWGYDGNEAAVDAEVVSNLATLLLAHAPSQRGTQARLETYLSATAGVPSASALASRIEQESVASGGPGSANGHGYGNGYTNGNAVASNNGTSTPRDLGSRLKILEIYVLHVLPRNEEWEYAKEFVHMSEVLDEERREAFLVALEGLEEEHAVESKKEKELSAQRQREKEAEEERATREKAAAEQRQKEREEAERQQKQQQAQRKLQTSNSATTSEGINEFDYGVDKRRPNRSAKTAAASSSSSSSSHRKSNSRQANGITGAVPAATSSSSAGAASKKPRPSPSSAPPTLYRRASLLFAALNNALFALGVNVTRHPVAVLRTVLFLIALVMALARQDVRARIARAKDTAWDKVRRTVGMGVKVSYI